MLGDSQKTDFSPSPLKNTFFQLIFYLYFSKFAQGEQKGF